MTAKLRANCCDYLSSHAIALSDQALVSGANFTATVLVGRLCGLAELGAYALAGTVLVVALGLQESLISSPYTVFLHATDEPERKSYCGSALQMSAWLIAAIVIFLAIASWIAEWIPALSPFSKMIRLLALVAPCIVLREFSRRIAFAHFDWRGAFLMDLNVTVVQVTGIVILGMTGTLSATSALVMLGVSALLGGSGWLFWNRKHFQLNRDRQWDDLRRHWAYGRWLCAERLTSIAHSNVVPWLVAILAGLKAAGGFGACLSLVAAANPFLMGLTNTLLPRASRSLATGGIQALRRELAASAIVLNGITALFAALLAISGSLLLRLAYGTDYVVYGPTLNVLSASMLVGMLCVAADFGLRALAKPQMSFVSSLVGISLTIGLLIGLIPGWGTLGAAFAMLAGEACASWICWFGFYRLTANKDGEPSTYRNHLHDHEALVVS